MAASFQTALNWMDDAHSQLASRLNIHPSVETVGAEAFSPDFRTLETAIILKAARIPSGLRAALALLELGLLQEQAAICRMIDEYQEDIVFLALSVLGGDHGALQEDYLEALFSPELRPTKPKQDWTRGRHLVPRKKIRAYIANSKLSGGNPSDQVAVASLLSHIYSGFVHAAAEQIMEMYNFSEKKFDTRGSTSKTLVVTHSNDLRNYFARGFYAFSFAARVFSYEEMFSQALRLGDEFSGIEAA